VRGTLPLEQYVEGVLSGDRATLGRAITLIESTRDDHQALAQQVLEAVLPRTGGAWRVGISGVPGAGKSTFIERLGRKLTASGHRVAVLAVDPSSSVSRGSILGDKTRMNELARDPNAFIRPSPSSGTLGGVAARTRETLLLCEAAGFDVVLVETVGVGQSETMVADMVDFFLVLLVAGAGDDLQGIKRGIVELADLIAINKADGQNVLPANRARKHYELALAHLTPVWSGWKPPVVTCSAVEGTGVDELWGQVTDHRHKLEESGELGRKRRRQARKWMWTLVEHLLMQRLHASDDVKRRIEELEARVANGETTAGLAAAEVLRVATET
jgi:LAO/AO transport system kinase